MANLFRRSNGIYYVVTCDSGRRVWRSTRCRTKREAENAIRKKLLPEISPSTLPPALPLLSSFARQYYEYARTILAPSTVILCRYAVNAFIGLLGDKPLDVYRVVDLERFKILRSKQVSLVKVNIEFRHLRAPFNTGVRWGLLEKYPFTGVRQIKIPPQRPVYLTKEDFSALLQVVSLGWFRELITFAVSTMMRAGEIVSLTWDSVDLTRRVIHVENRNGFRLKNRNPRAVPTNDWVFKFLATRVDKSGHVFQFPDGRPLNVHYAFLEC